MHIQLHTPINQMLRPTLKLFFTMLLVFVGTAEAAGPETDSETKLDTCKVEQNKECRAIYERASSQCNRYYLRETEAYSMCHESSRNRQDICVERGEQSCKDE